MRVSHLPKSCLRNGTSLPQYFTDYGKEREMVGAPQTEYELGDGGLHPASLRQLLSEPLRPPALIPPETGPSVHPAWLTPASCHPDRPIPLQHRRY